MAPLISPSPSQEVFYGQRPSSDKTVRSNGTVSPSQLYAGPRRTNSYKSQPWVTSVPIQDNANEQSAFPDLSLTDNALQFDDFSTYTTGTGLMSTTIADSNLRLSFDDYMTPDQSTDNYISEHTTPQEAIWEREFPQFLPFSSQPHILDSISQHSGHEEPEPKVIPGQPVTVETDQTQYISGAQLLSPQFTTPSPPGSARRRPAQPVSQSVGIMDRPNKKRGAESLQVSTDASTLYPQPSPRHGSVSPVIMVSSHSHGDSPAHPTPPRHRSLSRSRHSPVFDEPDTYTHLQPPGRVNSASNDEQFARTGLDPADRDTVEVATINQLAEDRQQDERNQEVEKWLSTSNQASDIGDRTTRQLRADRPRALSAGVKVDRMGLPFFSDAQIPGPGILIDEDSDDGYSEDTIEALISEPGSEAPESPAVDCADLGAGEEEGTSYFPPYEDEDIPPEMQEPLPRQFYRRGPWQDPLNGPATDRKWQPFSSNAAMMRYNEESAKWESASRSATWGTRRRLSDPEIQSIIDGSRVRHLSLVKRGRARGSTLIKKVQNKANDLLPRRSNSNIKKAAESPMSAEPVQLVESPQARESPTSINPIQRISSFGKTRSPPSDMATINTTFSNISQAEPVSSDVQKMKSEGGLRSPLHLLRKARSRSDVSNRSARSSPGLHELMAQYGGPPVMSMASPRPDIASQSPRGDNAKNVTVVDEDEEDLNADVEETGVRMDLRVRAETIIPNFEGFKLHAKHLNPRLEPYLIDRIGQEQVRRYKNLLTLRAKHQKSVSNRNCPSKGFCVDLGGQPKLLVPRPSTKDPEMSCAQFSVQKHGSSDNDDDEEVEDGVITPALFPDGIPVPPVKRLPAEFECFLCFKVKKFQKPSDWTKHVHEDIQPFSCTFPNCNDGKSFKRKADWVRHENERHRRLESWKCNVPECNHTCYRKDNFVQHLVREHKKDEPRNKSKSGGKGKGKHEDDELWQIVDDCRQESTSKPEMEPCKFCGNKLNSWKKLSVHMGKHMEQIAMPVLDLVKLKEITKDTIISPIEQNQQDQGNRKTSKSAAPQLYLPQGIPLEQFGAAQRLTSSPAMVSAQDPSLSPYARSIHSQHISSGTQSPAMMQASPHMGRMSYNESAYYTDVDMDGVQGPLNQSEAYDSSHGYDQASFMANSMHQAGQYGNVNVDAQMAQTYSPVPTMTTPHSAQSMSMGMGQAGATSYHDSGYGNAHTADMTSYRGFPPTSQAGSYDATMTNQQSYNVQQQYAQQQQQQQNMYYHQ